MISLHHKSLADQVSHLQSAFVPYEQTIQQLGSRWSRPGTQSDEEVELQQAKVASNYQKFQEEIAALAQRCKQDSSKGIQGDWEIPPENEQAFFQLTELNERVSSLFIRLNNTIRTNYPVARIEQFEPRVSALGSVTDLIKSNESMKPVLEGPLAHLSRYRGIAGDGNCFYTSFTVRLLETIRQENAFEAFITHIYDDGIDNPRLKETVVGILSEIQEYPSQLERILADNNQILPLVRYFREVAAHEMLNHPDPEEYEIPFRITLTEDFNEARSGDLPFVDLVREYVQKMGVDATQIPMRALCHKLAFPVRIHSPQRYTKPINTLNAQEPRAEFIRLGQHYFVGYSEGKVAEEKAGKPAISSQPGAKISSTSPRKLIGQLEVHLQERNESGVKGTIEQLHALDPAIEGRIYYHTHQSHLKAGNIKHANPRFGKVTFLGDVRSCRDATPSTAQKHRLEAVRLALGELQDEPAKKTLDAKDYLELILFYLGADDEAGAMESLAGLRALDPSIEGRIYYHTHQSHLKAGNIKHPNPRFGKVAFLGDVRSCKDTTAATAQKHRLEAVRLALGELQDKPAEKPLTPGNYLGQILTCLEADDEAGAMQGLADLRALDPAIEGRIYYHMHQGHLKAGNIKHPNPRFGKVTFLGDASSCKNKTPEDLKQHRIAAVFMTIGELT